MTRPRRRARTSRWAAVALVAATVAVACAAPEVEVRPPGRPSVELGAAVVGPEGRSPAGSVRTAYPDEPASFLDLAGDDPAARDLQSLWGLPLFRVDPSGQLTGGLVETWETSEDADGWTVELRLHSGRWSDGRDVTSADVVATLQALREGPRESELSLLAAATPVDDRTLRLTFTRPYARWWAVLDGVGVLPAHVLVDGGFDAYGSGVPVAGGAFQVGERVPGLRTTFVANPTSPLGAPGLERIDVSVVPRYEAALGMLRRGDVDVVLGYLALNPVERARRVPEVEAAAPLGGTTVGLWWRPDGPTGDPASAPRRRAAAGAIDVSQLVEGLLGSTGEPAASIVPGVDAPVAEASAEDGTDVGQPTVVLPRWAEAVAFTARALQRDLRSAGGGIELISEATPELVPLARRTGDAWLGARRTGPAPTLVGVIADRELALAADAGGRGSEAFDDALSRASEDVLAYPLYRIGVAHAWSPRVSGVRPSSWPGLAFWDAASWSSVAADRP